MRHTATHAALAAALLGLSATAQSQSGAVTVYGLLDLAVGRFEGAPAGVNAGDRALSQVASGVMSTSHIGLRGSEDLGGGLTANFELSSFLRPDTGAIGRNDAIGPPVNVAADTFWSRAAWVGVNSGRYGRLRLGNITTLLFLSRPCESRNPLFLNDFRVISDGHISQDLIQWKAIPGRLRTTADGHR